MSEDTNIVESQAFTVEHAHNNKVVLRERVVISFDRAGYSSCCSSEPRPLQTRLAMLTAALQLRKDAPGTTFCQASHHAGWKVILIKQ